jgi:branched-chain amino acid transport system ATP-binding protein
MLEVRALHSFYGDSQILHGIDLTVGPGERVAVLGRNGAGKTTLMKSIMNGGPSISGRVAWQGKDLGRMAGYARTRLGLSLVPEDRRIFAHLTAFENLRLAEHAVPKGQRAATPDEMIRHFPMLDPLRARYGNQLSGGQQQLLAVARGLVPMPALLLLDEPTEGLAPIIVAQMAASINAICDERGLALLLSEQNLWFARRCTTVVHVLDAGWLVFSGSWAELDAKPDVKNRHLAV